jgi:hypothetical protein
MTTVDRLLHRRRAKIAITVSDKACHFCPQMTLRGDAVHPD